MNDRFREIPARIDQTVKILEEMNARITHFETETLPLLGRTSDAVLIPVQLIENGYTAVETLFVRISAVTRIPAAVPSRRALTARAGRQGQPAFSCPPRAPGARERRDC